jgi:hypothetical protein
VRPFRIGGRTRPPEELPVSKADPRDRSDVDFEVVARLKALGYIE